MNLCEALQYLATLNKCADAIEVRAPIGVAAETLATARGDSSVIDSAIVDAYRWAYPPWGDPPIPTLLEEFRVDLTDSFQRHGLVITTQAQFDQLKAVEAAARGLVERGYDDFTFAHYTILRATLAGPKPPL